MAVPRLRAGQRLSVQERQRVAAELAEQYQAGRSIRELCGASGYSIGRVRRLLAGAGVTFRSRGGSNRKTAGHRTDEPSSPS